MTLYADQIRELLSHKDNILDLLKNPDMDEESIQRLRKNLSEIQAVLDEALCTEETFSNVQLLMKEARSQYGG